VKVEESTYDSRSSEAWWDGKVDPVRYNGAQWDWP